MLCVGFLEEIIFCGFLFRELKKRNLLWAILVTSVIFGLVHISQDIVKCNEDSLKNLLLIVQAMVLRLVYILIFYRTKSLYVCIGSHFMFNMLGAFTNQSLVTPQKFIIFSEIVIVVGLIYSIYIISTMNRNLDS